MKNLPSKSDIIIIGGGIIGVSIAYYLAKRNVTNILLIEKGIMGEGATGKCAGGIRTQFSTVVNVELSKVSINTINGFQAEFGVDPEFQKIGYLFLAANEQQLSVLQRNKALLQSLDLDMDLLDRESLQSQYPFLNTDDLLGGSFTGDDGYAGPYEMLQGFAKNARRLGAVLKEGIEVTGIHHSKGAISGIETSTGQRIDCNVLINAAGPFASQVALMAGLDLPVLPIRRQLFFTDRFNHVPREIPMIIDLEYGWYMRREGDGLLLAGPKDEESSFKQYVDNDAWEWTAERSLHRVPVLEKSRISSSWAGLYSLSPDNHAIIGEFPELKGFICANGFSGHGFMHSPAVGMLVSELVTTGKTETLDIRPLRPTRFREDDLITESLTAFRS
ncbi:MAG: FAD-binding oxidoreductase [Deltaproteobacteria bacterium]|nr:FAD-binding oxidoreductase [Deltaproteobacteria bacterium]